MKSKNLIIILLLVLAGFTVWFFWHIFIYIIIAAILALVGQPIDRFYTKHLRFKKISISSSLSAALAFLTLFLVFFLLILFFIPLAAEEAKILSSLDRETIIKSIQQPIGSVERIMQAFNIDLEGMNFQAYLQEKFISLLSVTNLSLLFNKIIGAMGDFFIAIFAISFLTFFFLRDETLIISTLFSPIPEKYTEKANKVWIEAQRMLKRYFIGVLLEVLIVITFLSVGLWIAGIRHALLIGLFAGIMNVIPYIGPLIGCAFALFIGMTTNVEMSTFSVIVKILIVFPIVNLSDAFLLQPLIYSSSVKSHPLEIFLVILAGATIGGIGGMILAVPSYTILRVITKEALLTFREQKQKSP